MIWGLTWEPWVSRRQSSCRPFWLGCSWRGSPWRAGSICLWRGTSLSHRWQIYLQLQNNKRFKRLKASSRVGTRVLSAKLSSPSLNILLFFQVVIQVGIIRMDLKGLRLITLFTALILILFFKFCTKKSIKLNYNVTTMHESEPVKL